VDGNEGSWFSAVDVIELPDELMCFAPIPAITIRASTGSTTSEDIRIRI